MKRVLLLIVASACGSATQGEAFDPSHHENVVHPVAAPSSATKPIDAPKTNAAPPTLCVPRDVDVVGHAAGATTLCSKGACVASSNAGLVTATPPSKPLRKVQVLHELQLERPALVYTGSEIRRKDAPKKWAPIPFSPANKAELLWTWGNGARAIVYRHTGGEMEPKPIREQIDLVDLDAHAHLAHAEMCNHHIEIGLAVDDGDHVARIAFYHDNPTILAGLIDLDHARFVPVIDPLPPKKSGTYDGCAPDDFDRYFSFEERIGSMWDVARRHVEDRLLSLEGKIVARVDGGFAPGPLPYLPTYDLELEIDADTHLFVALDRGEAAGKACVAVARAVAVDAPASSSTTPTCAPLCSK